MSRSLRSQVGWDLANVNVRMRPGGDEHAGLRQAFKTLVLRAIT